MAASSEPVLFGYSFLPHVGDAIGLSRDAWDIISSSTIAVFWAH